jgi:hypothetical protein
MYNTIPNKYFGSVLQLPRAVATYGVAKKDNGAEYYESVSSRAFIQNEYIP